MVKLVTNTSVTYTTPILGADGKPTQSKIKFNNREVIANDVEHHRVEAETLIDVSEDIAKELLDGGHVRLPDPALDPDDEVDPTQTADDSLT